MSTTAEEAASEPWEPLSVADVSILGLIGTLQAFALLICAHLLKWRKWPPYVTKSPVLVVIATVSGVLWTVSMAIASGFIERSRGDILAACDFERFLSWSTLCVHTVAFFIRVYRMWRILIKHDANMRRTEHQVLFMSSVSLVPVIATWIAPHSGYFDETANTCATNALSAAVVLGMDTLGFLAICFLWFVCARQLKFVRKQFNEYDTMKRTLLYMTITLSSYALVVVILLADDLVLQRRVSIFYPLLTTYILLWGSIREPFLMKMLGDDEYLWSYTKGFAELPSPAQLKASLAEQLSVDQLRDEFRRYIKTKVAQELVDFYLDSLDREEVAGFFERQAVTMRIVEQYIREGAPDQVNISGECREKILATDVTAFSIFDEARQEVLTVMETNFRKDFVTTEGFQRILDASEEEQREMRFLRAGGMLPVRSPLTPASGGESKKPTPFSPLPTDRRELPVSPPFLEGLKDALRKLPHLVRNAKAASEARRRRRVTKGGARVGGAVRASASLSTIGARGGSGDRKEGEAIVDSDLALERTLQREEEEAIGCEAPQLARSEVGGAAAAAASPTSAGDIEMGERGVGAAPGVSGVTPEVCAMAWHGGGVAAGERSVVFYAAAAAAAAAASPHPHDASIGGDRAPHVPDCCRGQDNSGGGDQYARVAVPPQTSSLALSLSASASGSNSKGGNSSDNPSSDSLLGIYLTSWPDRQVHRSSSGGGGGGGGSGDGDRSNRAPFADALGVEALLAGGEGRRDATRDGGGQEKGPSRTSAAGRAASPAGAAHARPDRMYQGVLRVGRRGGRGFAYLGDTEEGISSSGGGGSSSSSSPAGLARLGRAELTIPELKHLMVPPAHGDSDRSPREDGVEGLEGLSPVLTEDSPDWVRFSEWIEREKGVVASESDETLTRGSTGGGGVGARRIMASLSPDVSGGGGGGGSCGSVGEQTGESWCSGSSSWSNIKNTTSGSETSSAPRTPPCPHADGVEAEYKLTPA